jgi:thioredoxin-like negative regulator of GroEL
MLACAVALMTFVSSSAAFGAVPAGKSKLLTVLIASAQREFEAGQFERAGELFLQIWKQDSSQTSALYNAARSFHMAGKLDKAEELYRELLVPGRADEAMNKKVSSFLADVRARRGEVKAEDAGRAEQAGDFALAAQLWADAVQMVPTKMAWLLRGARAEHLAGHLDAARKGYDRYLAEAPAEEPDRAPANRWRTELMARVEEGRARPTAVVAARPNAKSPEPGAQVAGYVTAGLGVLTLIAGGVTLGLASRDDGALQNEFKNRNAQGWIGGMTYGEATSKANGIETRYQVGWVMTGTGAVAAAVGSWLVVRRPDSNVSVAADGAGARLAIRF